MLYQVCWNNKYERTSIIQIAVEGRIIAIFEKFIQ